MFHDPTSFLQEPIRLQTPIRTTDKENTAKHQKAFSSNVVNNQNPGSIKKPANRTAFGDLSNLRGTQTPKQNEKIQIKQTPTLKVVAPKTSKAPLDAPAPEITHLPKHQSNPFRLDDLNFNAKEIVSHKSMLPSSLGRSIKKSDPVVPTFEILVDTNDINIDDTIDSITDDDFSLPEL
mmetsp:Transcript_8375/g.11549  ORF Transcript_8375/g.11549 Transcript_8375/m.11549 type:complete len:178 (-) Transcript_8375:237-770(-)